MNNSPNRSEYPHGFGLYAAEPPGDSSEEWDVEV